MSIIRWLSIVFDVLTGLGFGFKVFAAAVYAIGGFYLFDYYNNAKSFSRNTLNLLTIAGLIGFVVAFKDIFDFEYVGLQRVIAIISGIIAAIGGFFLFASDPGRER